MEPLAIVTEFVGGGSLYDLIHSTTKLLRPLQFKIIQGVSAGMMHLEAERFVHRDLAARNVLLKNDHTPVIADFGMSRHLGQETAKKTRSDVGPLKWMVS
jgi:serine/threonine protein kinase